MIQIILQHSGFYALLTQEGFTERKASLAVILPLPGKLLVQHEVGLQLFVA